MCKLLVNIRGTNGSGKSTVPIKMMNDPDKYTIEKKIEGRKKPKTILTVFPTYGWVALGSYENKTGGLDVIPSNKTTRKILWYALKKFPEYDILMEGIIASTIRSTYIKIFHEIEREFDRKVIVLSFTPPVDICIKRVKQRNGCVKVDEKAIESKWKIVKRNVEHFKAEGFISISVDNSNTKLDFMLHNFLKLMEKYRNA